MPYIDFAATNLLDVLTAKSQELVAGQTTPEDFAKAVQAQYEQFKPWTSHPRGDAADEGHGDPAKRRAPRRLRWGARAAPVASPARR